MRRTYPIATSVGLALTAGCAEPITGSWELTALDGLSFPISYTGGTFEVPYYYGASLSVAADLSATFFYSYAYYGAAARLETPVTLERDGDRLRIPLGDALVFYGGDVTLECGLSGGTLTCDGDVPATWEHRTADFVVLKHDPS